MQKSEKVIKEKISRNKKEKGDKEHERDQSIRRKCGSKRGDESRNRGARFNEIIVNKLLGGAVDGLVRHGVSDDNITAAWVPGAFEIPITAARGKFRKV